MKHNSCCGLAGWLFGHRFVDFVVKSEPVEFKPQVSEQSQFYMFRSDVAAMYSPRVKTESVVVCGRCGMSPIQEEQDAK